MIYTASFELEGQPCGTFTFPSSAARLANAWENTAYFCRTCGRVWGKMAIAGSDQWNVLYGACERHSDNWSIRGAFTTGSRLALLSHLPEALVRREFNQHLEQFV